MSDSVGERDTIRLDRPLAVELVFMASGIAGLILMLLKRASTEWSMAINFGMLLYSIAMLLFNSHGVEIDSKNIRTSVPMDKKRCGSMRWADVRVVGIYRPSGRNGRLFISTIPEVWYEQDLTSNRFDPNQLEAFKNNKKNLKIIRKFYAGEIVEIQ